jgi:hypothetical protein
MKQPSTRLSSIFLVSDAPPAHSKFLLRPQLLTRLQELSGCRGILPYYTARSDRRPSRAVEVYDW